MGWPIIDQFRGWVGKRQKLFFLLPTVSVGRHAWTLFVPNHGCPGSWRNATRSVQTCVPTETVGTWGNIQGSAII